ncbi:MAG: NYN domain-containing protein [Chloroflexota bacterium]
MHWLIDGHNLIGQMPNLRLSDPHDEAELLEYLRRYRARTGHRLTVVFDAGPSYQPAPPQKKGDVTVLFARPGQTADQVIKRRLRKIRDPQGTIVVTSDRALQQAAQRLQVRVVEAGEFGQQLLQLSAAGQEVADRGSLADVRLSADEVEEWLTLFSRQKDEQDDPLH